MWFTAEYACIWCKCPKKQRCDMTICWSMTDIAKGVRTISEISKLSKSNKHRYNCCRNPLFPFIALHRVSLHLFLCIADVLINLLIRDLRILDGIDSSKACIKTYEAFLNESCKIRFQWFVDKDSKWRDLTGPEKIRLFLNIDISVLFPHLKPRRKSKNYGGFSYRSCM